MHMYFRAYYLYEEGSDKLYCILRLLHFKIEYIADERNIYLEHIPSDKDLVCVGGHPLELETGQET